MSFRNRRFHAPLEQGSHRKLRIEPLEDRRLLAGDFQILGDVNSQSMPVGQDRTNESVVIGDVVFFAADDGSSGRELWKSDGTSEGTVLIKNIDNNREGSVGGYLTALNDVLYFSGSDSRGHELWRSDGTAEGTYLVKDIFEGQSGSSPHDLIAFDGALYFTASQSGSWGNPWKSDGTEEGTVRLTFPASTSGRTDIVGSTPNSLFLFRGYELWATDGSDGGMTKLHRFAADLEGMDFRTLANVGDDFYFTVSHASSGTELWKSNGTVEGTRLVKRVGPTHNMYYVSSGVSVGERLLFAANDGAHGTELWSSDGTEAGTFMLKDIWPGQSTSPLFPGPLSSGPQELVNVNGVAYFGAVTNQGGELWKSDGTREGTQTVKSDAFGEYALPRSLANIDGALYFSSRLDGAGLELWKSDGTEAGTFRIKDINKQGHSYPQLRTYPRTLRTNRSLACVMIFEP